ncbi:MAG: hypothetical protein WC700_04260 [Gemmatimonadaceae bacterium]|jgi:hypothetical protein
MAAFHSRSTPIEILRPARQCEGGHAFRHSALTCAGGCGTVYCRCGAETHRQRDRVVAGHDPACGRGDALSIPADLQCENKHRFQHDTLVACDNGCRTAYCRCGASVHRRGRWILAGHDPACGQNRSL